MVQILPEQTQRSFNFSSSNTKIGRVRLLSIYGIQFNLLILNILISMSFDKINKSFNSKILPTKIFFQEISSFSLKISEFLFWKNFEFKTNGFDLKKPTIFLAQHQSFIEELIAASYVNPAFAYFHKFSEIPIVGFVPKYFFEKLNFAPVGSSKEGSSDLMINKIQENLGNKKSFLFYPEGQVNGIENANIKAMPGGMTKVLQEFFNQNGKFSEINEIPIICTDTGLLFQGKTRVKKHSNKIKESLPETLKIEIVAKITKNGIEFLNQDFEEYFRNEIKKKTSQNSDLIKNELINLTGKKYNLKKHTKFLKDISQDINNLDNFEKLIQDYLFPHLKKQKEIFEIRKKEEENKSYFSKNSRLITEYNDEILRLEKQINSFNDSLKLEKAKENLKADIEAVINCYRKYNDSENFKFNNLNEVQKSNLCRKEFDLILRAYNKKSLERFGNIELDNINEIILNQEKK